MWKIMRMRFIKPSQLCVHANFNILQLKGVVHSPRHNILIHQFFYIINRSMNLIQDKRGHYKFREVEFSRLIN